MSKLEKLKSEREQVKRQVEIFEKKYKNYDTVWHQTLDRLNKEIKHLETKKKKPTTAAVKEEIVKESNDG